MQRRSETLLRWSPRIAGILVCLFLSLFALDAFGEGKSFFQAIPDFLIHLAPMIVLLAVVAISWRREWVGGLVFTGLAAAYAYGARSHPDWVAAISGPLLLVGLLFAASWVYRHRTL